MKKKYSRPQIAFDSFEMASNFAAACYFAAEHAQNECAYNVGGFITIFNSSISPDCIFDVVDDDGDFGVCYYVPTADNNVFGS